jgi:hypothetical protein
MRFGVPQKAPKILSAMIADKAVTTTSQERETSLPWGELDSESSLSCATKTDEHEREGDEANDGAQAAESRPDGGLDGSDWNEGSSFN